MPLFAGRLLPSQMLSDKGGDRLPIRLAALIQKLASEG